MRFPGLSAVMPGAARGLGASRADLIVVPLVLAVLLSLGWQATRLAEPLDTGFAAVSLAPGPLVGYALRTTLRMVVGLVLSIVFALVYGTAAAKSRRAERVLIPLLDVLQSVPVLGYVAVFITFFLALFPNRQIGAELAVVFALFTSQAWNLAFSLHQSLTTVPADLREAARAFRFNAWRVFWRLELPFAMPGLIWNAMLSMAGGWFFVVASEAITVGDTRIAVPGVGSYLALAIARQDLVAIGWAALAMSAAILTLDQLLFRPLVAWTERFKAEHSAAAQRHGSWALDLYRRARLANWAARPVAAAARLALRLPWPAARPARVRVGGVAAGDIVWYLVLGAVLVNVGRQAYELIAADLGWGEVLWVILLGGRTAMRVALVTLAALVLWVPLGVAIGLRPRLARAAQPVAQLLASFPANLLFPPAALAIVHWRLDPDLWLTGLFLLGSQWYVAFNAIAGAAAFPAELREAARAFRMRGGMWWRRVMLPGIYPYILTGAVTAAGACWNASIVAEFVSWGDLTIEAHGLGAYIAHWTAAGDLGRVALGIAVMSRFVALSNRLVWRPLYNVAERHWRLD
ncbi:transporter [Aliidongia dinghuensis]|uniref:Transporter n=1 Tax=Aliidongia dinghuensis TaxID=1867774 RepID=A0A8J3E5U1_9PROT|nr:ABC transporter permease subunit [Aliidongia dinghuensis]GGF38635.1 transporter [Aliidongia dinghuensis]